MKATFKGSIHSIERGESMTNVKVDLKGKVDSNLISAQESYLKANLVVKTIVADQLKVGATLIFTVSDEDQENNS